MSKLSSALYILSLLRRYGPMSRREIAEKYALMFPFEKEMSRLKFGRYKQFLEETFHCVLSYDSVTNKYTLTSPSAANGDADVLDYVLALGETQVASSLLMKHAERIHHVEIPTGSEHLEIILKAIDNQRGIECSYQSFVNNTIKRRTLIPLFLSIWEGRWYLVAEVTTHPGTSAVYALERMKDIILTDIKMSPSIVVNKEEYFHDSYGIQHASTDDHPIDIIIKAEGAQVGYLLARPIHKSQQVISFDDTCAIFQLHLTPCYNFYQQLLWHRESIEVLEPHEVRQEIRLIIDKMLGKYRK